MITSIGVPGVVLDIGAQSPLGEKECTWRTRCSSAGLSESTREGLQARLDRRPRLQRSFAEEAEELCVRQQRVLRRRSRAQLKGRPCAGLAHAGQNARREQVCARPAPEAQAREQLADGRRAVLWYAGEPGSETTASGGNA
jgi:hypothetical protein